MTCNGTSHIAEIVRFITELCAHDRISDKLVKDIRCEWMQSKESVRNYYRSCANMYDFLYAVSFGYYPKSPGTCCDPRHTFSNRGKRFDFEKHCDSILDLIDDCCIEDDVREKNNLTFVAKKYNQLKNSLLKKSGFGPMSVQEFIQLSALLQLTTQKMAKIASCDGEDSKTRGPNVFIRMCLVAAKEKFRNESINGDRDHEPNTEPEESNGGVDESEVNKIFLDLHLELMKIVSNTGAQNRVTQTVVENTLCEMKRMWDIWNHTKEGKIALKTLSLMERMDLCFSASNIEKLADKTAQRNVDVIYIYRNRHAGRNVQKLFKLDVAKDKLIMHTHVFDMDQNHQSVEKTDVREHMFWDKHNKNLTISHELQSEYTSTLGCTSGNMCSLCIETCRNSAKKSSTSRLIKKATRTCSLNVCKNNINCHIRQRDYTVGELPRIPKKDIDLNQLKSKIETKKNKKRKKRSRVKDMAGIQDDEQCLGESGSVTLTKCNRKRRKRSRNRDEEIPVGGKSSDTSKGKH